MSGKDGGAASFAALPFSGFRGFAAWVLVLFPGHCISAHQVDSVLPGLLDSKGMQDCSISQSREPGAFISDIFLGLHLWRISLIYLLAPCGCVPEAEAQEWKPPLWAAHFFIFPFSISRSTGFHCS